MQNKTYRYLSIGVALASLGTTLLIGTASAANIPSIKPAISLRAKHSITNKTKKKPVVISGLSGTKIGAEGSGQEEGSENSGQRNAEVKNFGMRRGPGVGGTVTAINGTSFTIIMNGRGKKAVTSTPITYTVNTDSNTIFIKDNVTSTISDIVNGQRIMVAGTVDKTALTVAATKINITTKPMIKPTIKIGTKSKGHSKKGIGSINKIGN